MKVLSQDEAEGLYDASKRRAEVAAGVNIRANTPVDRIDKPTINEFQSSMLKNMPVVQMLSPQQHSSIFDFPLVHLDRLLEQRRCNAVLSRKKGWWMKKRQNLSKRTPRVNGPQNAGENPNVWGLGNQKLYNNLQELAIDEEGDELGNEERGQEKDAEAVGRWILTWKASCWEGWVTCVHLSRNTNCTERIPRYIDFRAK